MADLEAPARAGKSHLNTEAKAKLGQLGLDPDRKETEKDQRYGWEIGKLDWGIVEKEAKEAWRDLPPETFSQKLAILRDVYNQTTHFNMSEGSLKDGLLRRFIRDLREDNFIGLHSLGRIARAENILDLGNSDQARQEAVTQTMQWMLRDRVLGKDVSREGKQGRNGGLCFAASTFLSESPGEIARLTADLVVDGKATTKSGMKLRYGEKFGDLPESADLTDRTMYSRTEFAGRIIRTVASGAVEADEQAEGAWFEKTTLLLSQTSGNYVVGVRNRADAGDVYIGPDGQVTLNAGAPGVRSQSTYDYFESSVQNSKTRVIAQVEWDDDGTHLQHVIEVIGIEERYSEVTKRLERCYLVRDPQGQKLGGEDKELAPGKVAGSGDPSFGMAYEIAEGEGGRRWIPESVMRRNLHFFAVDTGRAAVPGSTDAVVFANRFDIPEEDRAIPATESTFKEIEGSKDWRSDNSATGRSADSDFDRRRSSELHQNYRYAENESNGWKNARGETNQEPRPARNRSRGPRSTYELELERIAQQGGSSTPVEDAPKPSNANRFFGANASAEIARYEQQNPHMVTAKYGPSGQGAISVDTPSVSESGRTWGFTPNFAKKIVKP